MVFQRVAILGVGLMGGSVGMACLAGGNGVQVIGYGHNPAELDLAIGRGAIHRGTTNLTEAAETADLVIFCTPVGAFGPLMTAAAPVLRPGAIVTDVGSTKRSIIAMAKTLLPGSIQFVGSHPMVGGEKHGIQNARADLLQGGLCIVTSDDPENPAVGQVAEFWKQLGMRTICMTPQKHDQLTADISHLPHAIAAALVRIQSGESLQIAARGFLDTTRIAGGDSALWRDIFLDNRDNLKSGIQRLQLELQHLLGSLEAGDAAAVAAWLAVAARTRDEIRPRNA